MKLIHKRAHCVVCNENSFDDLITFQSFPVYMGVSENEERASDLESDMIWSSCQNCKLVQLINLVDLDILYHKGHNPAIGKMWEQHHKQLGTFVRKHAGERILEIGGGNLKLANNILKDNSSVIEYHVYDKNEYENPPDDRVRFHRAFFSDSLGASIDCDTIIHSHVLEHVYEPIKFLSDINKTLSQGQKMIFAVPDIGMMIDKKYTNSMNFEHTFYTDEKIIRYMLKFTGFDLIDIQRFNNDIMFISASKTHEIFDSAAHENMKDRYDYTISNVKNFIDFHKNVVDNLNTTLSDKRAYVFGAHIFTQFLLAFGLNSSALITALDNDPGKIGHRLYGTDLDVESPKVLSKEMSPIVILRAAQYNDEIKKDIEENINEDVCFIAGE